MSHTDVLFRDLRVDDSPEVTEMESMCPNCHDDGITRILITKIPFFREVIVASFSCEECSFHNTSIDFAGKYQDKGVKLELTVLSKDDLDRRVVLNQNSVIRIPELDSCFPISVGALTTIEGVLTIFIDNLNVLQDARREVSPELADQLDIFIEKMRQLLHVTTPFVIELEDATGNSTIENFLAPKTDPQLSVKHFRRSREENDALGINESEIVGDENQRTYVDETQEEFKYHNEVLIFQVNCNSCNAEMECRMKSLDIPHFKEIIVMSSACDICGIKENKIIGGCGIAKKGQRITLRIEEPLDLVRDFLKSDSAGIRIPELDVECIPGSLIGRFTTVEGILLAMADNMIGMKDFLVGDSATKSNGIVTEIMANIRRIASGEMTNVTLVVTDPAGNSYIQDLYSPEKDPRLSFEQYDRTADENEELGLNGMILENYEQ